MIAFVYRQTAIDSYNWNQKIFLNQKLPDFLFSFVFGEAEMIFAGTWHFSDLKNVLNCKKTHTNVK